MAEYDDNVAVSSDCAMNRTTLISDDEDTVMVCYSQRADVKVRYLVRSVYSPLRSLTGQSPGK